jgi:NADH dehydrogenase
MVRAGRSGELVPGADRVVVGQLPYDIPRSALADVDAVIHSAAVTTSSASEESEATNLAGTAHLLRAVRYWRPGIRIVFISTQSVLGQSDSAYAQTKRQAESMIRQSGLPYVIVRPGLVIGPGSTGLFARMRQTIRKLPVLPLLGGGRALVQAIEVSDLCDALGRCVQLPPEDCPELNLGDSHPISLAGFLQQLARAETGRPRLALSIPLAPIKLAVSLGQALRVPLPISKDNIRGMETVISMDTAPSLDHLGMKLPALSQALERCMKSPEVNPEVLRKTRKPVRILIVGAGKISLVHTLNILQRSGAELAGFVDRQPAAFGVYRGLGVTAPFETHIDQAIERWKPDGAIVCTPASTHPSLARLLAVKGLGVLIEKPAAISQSGLEDYRRLLEDLELSGRPHPPLQVGYMAAQYPHLAKAKALIVEGKLGPIRRVRFLALQSHIMGSKPLRWEMMKVQSGGGALINFAGHVLTMVGRLFGLPLAIERIGLCSIHSQEVEDAGWMEWDQDGLRIQGLFSWSMPGYPTPENQIVVEGDRGTLLIRNGGLKWSANGVAPLFWSQRAWDLGFNVGPDYTGAGFAAEHRSFIQALRLYRGDELAGSEEGSDGLGPVTLQEALEFEEFLQNAYQVAMDQPGQWALAEQARDWPQPFSLTYDRLEQQRRTYGGKVW